MSLQVNFNGSRLVKPGAASRVISRLQSFGSPGTGNLGIVGQASCGPKGIQRFTNPEAMKALYRNGDLADAAEAAFRPSADPRIAGGPAEVFAYNLRNNTQATLAGNLVNGTAAALIAITSKLYGTIGNKISVAWDSGTKVLTVVLNDGLKSVKETSPAISGDRFTLKYTGAAATATVAIAFTTDTAGTLTTTLGAGGEVGAALNIDLSLFATIEELLAAINNHASGKYTAALVAGANPSGPCSALDRITGVDIKTPANPTIGAQTQDVIDWCNNSSSLISAARSAAATAGTPATLAATLLTNGAYGAAPTAADYATAFNALKGYRVNATVPLQSSDIVGGCTMADMVAAAVSYSTLCNGAAGRNEVEVYVGLDGTKTTAKAMASGTLNSGDVVLCCQKHTLRGADGSLKVMSAWSSALLYAAMRCSAPLGEPITYKYVRSYGVTQDATIVLPDATDEMLLAGVSLFEYVEGKGIRLVKGNTTWTRTDDDAYTEESVVHVWKTYAHDLRSYLEDKFTGTRGTPTSVGGIADEVGAFSEKWRTAEAIVDSQDDDGAALHAWRDVSVVVNKDVAEISVTITPVEGINFTLPTIYLAPVKLSA